MACFSEYITVDSTTPSQSGLYVVDLPGVTVKQLHDLTKDEQADFYAFFDYIYGLAQKNLRIDVQKKLAARFHIDKKLVSRETSSFLDEVNASGELSGVKLSFNLPKYARVQILSIGVYSESAEVSPGAQFFVYKESADGELLSTITGELAVGRNEVKVYESFEEDEIFIAYDPGNLSLRKTENKYYADATYENLTCIHPCAYGDTLSVTQINGGGLNVKILITCSIEKFICENLPLFQYALWYRIGVDLMKERVVSDRVTRFTVISEERAVELTNVFKMDYDNALEAATMNIRMTEDPVCFICKRPITAVTSLP